MIPVQKARRWALVGVAVALAVLVAGIVIATVRAGRDDDADARSAAERYLGVLADDGQDPRDLADLLALADTEALDRADALLATARERITDVSLGDSRETSTARTPGGLASDLAFDRFEQVEVRYRLAGERHRATITMGLPSDDSGRGWLVVVPLSGQVDWNAAAWGAAPLDLTVGDVAVTEPERTTYEPDAQLVHPAVYPVRASVGPYFASPETDLPVAAGARTTPLPSFDLAPTSEGTAAITEATLAAFDRCRRGTAYCPVADLVYPAGDSPLPDGWWQGFTTEPTVTVDGTSITLVGGEFRYSSPSGPRTVRFSGTGAVAIDPATGEPGLAAPLTIERQP